MAGCLTPTAILDLGQTLTSTFLIPLCHGAHCSLNVRASGLSGMMICGSLDKTAQFMLAYPNLNSVYIATPH